MSIALNKAAVLNLYNRTGGSVVRGDVVILDTGNPDSFVSAASPGQSNGLVGIVSEYNGIASLGQGAITLSGYVSKIKLDASASLGQVFNTSASPGYASPHSIIVTGDFGQVLESGASPAAWLWGLPVQSSGDSPAGLFSLQAPIVAGAGGLASFDFTGIPATFNKLIFDIYGRGDTAATSADVYATFNGDSSALYDYLQESVHDPASIGTTVGRAAASALMGTIAAANSPANGFDMIRIEITGYASNQHKICLTDFSLVASTTSGSIYRGRNTVKYRSVDAINRMTLTLGAGNFAQYSRAAGYGVF